MLDTPCSEVVWRVLDTHSVRQFSLHFPSRASPCAITFQLDSKAVDTLSLRHVSSCDVNTCSWDVRGDLTLNSMTRIYTCHSAYVTWSRVELWSAHVPARLSNFCCRTHFVRRDVRVERSSDVTSCFQKWRKCLLKKCVNGAFYMTPSYRIIEISIVCCIKYRGITAGYTLTDCNKKKGDCKWVKYNPSIGKNTGPQKFYILHVNRMPCNAEGSEKWLIKRQKEPDEVIKKTTGCMTMERVNRWPRPKGRRNQLRSLKRLLDVWQRKGSTDGPDQKAEGTSWGH
jgi:hypothetical protein